MPSMRSTARRPAQRTRAARNDQNVPDHPCNAHIAGDRRRDELLGEQWSRVRGSNSPPHDYKSSALPTELTRRGSGNVRGLPSIKPTGNPATTRERLQEVYAVSAQRDGRIASPRDTRTVLRIERLAGPSTRRPRSTGSDRRHLVAEPRIAQATAREYPATHTRERQLTCDLTAVRNRAGCDAQVDSRLQPHQPGRVGPRARRVELTWPRRGGHAAASSSTGAFLGRLRGRPRPVRIRPAPTARQV